MATYTRWFTVCRQLAVLQRARPGYRDPFAVVEGIPVFNGPTYGITGDHPTSWMAFGWAGFPERAQESGEATQSVATLGNRARDNSGSIRCRAVCDLGERSIEDAQDGADAMLADLESWLRVNPTLGLDQAWMRSAEMGPDLSITQRFGPGAIVEIDFIVSFRTRI